MAVDIELAINLIQAQNLLVSGVLEAPALSAYRTAIDTPNLPYVITWPAEGSFYAKGGAYKADHRIMRVIAFVEPLGQSDLPTRAVEAVQLLQAMRDRWITNSVIPLQDPVGGVVYQITAESGPDRPHSDTGLVSNLVFSGRQFHGFEIRLNVRILWST
jgi:hypothetical protein